MTSAVNTSPEHQEHADILKEMRAEYKGIWIHRFIKAETENQLSEKADANALAEFFTTLIQGMAVKAKDGASNDELQNTAKLGMTCLSQYCN